MKSERITLIISIIFISAMVILTLSARSIKNNYMLPNVECIRLTNATYYTTFTDTDGTEFSVSRTGLSINKELYNQIMEELGGIYLVDSGYKNNEQRNFVKITSLNFDTETQTDYIIGSGISRSDFLIINSNKQISEGDEIFVKR